MDFRDDSGREEERRVRHPRMVSPNYGGLIFKAHRLLHYLTLGSRIIKIREIEPCSSKVEDVVPELPSNRQKLFVLVVYIVGRWRWLIDGR